MGKIRLLPPEIVSRISAGEVIERPCFAVKELIENSIDAGTDYIKIDLDQGGFKKIQVIDSGEGMDREDLEKCFLPHSTSKLKDDNLNSIQTLGFRGEALSSIAAISQVRIVSRREKDNFGYQIEVENGMVIVKCKTGSPVGTSVIVQNLFSTVPARKKFLKSLRTEFRYILDVVTSFALAYPKIRFELWHNKRLILDLPKNQHLLERIKALLGITVFENLVPVKFEESYLKIDGFLCKPQISSSNLNKQHLFINGRGVKDPVISTAVKESYGSLLDATAYPVFILFFDVPFEIVDVNIHPRKEQVSFYNKQLIHDLVYKAVSQTLSENNLTFYNLNFGRVNGNGGFVHFNPGLTTSFAGQLLKNELLPWLDGEVGQINRSDDLLQVHNLYLISQTKKGIILIDQHAASERILYEKFLRLFLEHKSKKEKYQLEQAVLLDLSLSDTRMLLENITLFEELGFGIEQFGETTFKIESVPLLFKDRDIVLLVNETLDDLIRLGMPKDVDSRSRRMLSYLACRSAIKAGEKLTKQQAKDLLKELSQFEGAYTCPHGRPVKIEISLNQINKLFKRS